MKICPKCSTSLDKLTIKIDGKFKEIWIHPEGITKCDSQDGCKVGFEILDEFLFEKFQNGVKENSNRVTDSNIEKKFNVAPKIYKESNISILKHRLAKGEIDIHTFDTIKAIVEDK